MPWSSCVDRASVHLLLMSAKSQYCQTMDEQALADINTINATIQFVASLNKTNEQKQVFDNNSGTFRPFIDITDNNYQTINIRDEVEDILHLLNSGLLQTVEGCDMRHGDYVTLKNRRHIDAARSAILNSLVPLELPLVLTTDNVELGTAESSRDRARELEIGINHWVNEPDLSHQQYAYRMVAKRLILEAYNQQSQQLSLNNLLLSSLPPEIGLLTELRELRLDWNKLTSLPPEIGQLSQLKKLALNWNQIDQLPAEFSRLTALEILDLGSNRLNHLPAELENLTALRELSLSRNQLSALPPLLAEGQLTALSHLNLGRNRLHQLDFDALPQNSDLTINLRYNPLSSSTRETLNRTQAQAGYNGPTVEY